MKSFDDFLKLHHQSQPLLIGNVWDVKSAQVVEKIGYKAIGTSSAAVANSFGYEDGEQLPFELLIQLAKRINQVTELLVSVDIEGGFSRNVEGICQNGNSAQTDHCFSRQIDHQKLTHNLMM
jgi:2-methylisocitrate lyase-like PEP mutase family enzyme